MIETWTRASHPSFRPVSPSLSAAHTDGDGHRFLAGRPPFFFFFIPLPKIDHAMAARGRIKVVLPLIARKCEKENQILLFRKPCFLPQVSNSWLAEQKHLVIKSTSMYSHASPSLPKAIKRRKHCVCVCMCTCTCIYIFLLLSVGFSVCERGFLGG